VLPLVGNPDEVPEQVVGKSMPGDVWLLGPHRLMCGDSTSPTDVEKLMAGAKADMVFTDPPYGVNYDGGHAEKGKRREKIFNDGNADIYEQCLPLASSNSKDNAALYLWFSDSKSSAVIAAVIAAGYEIRNTLIWNKNLAQFGAIGAQYKSKHEPCLYAFKKGKSPFWNGPTNEVSVWDIARQSKNEFHPTQKPTELGVRAMNNSCPAKGLVLDLFGGSGSTLIAAHQTNRVAYLMELDPKYVDVICARFQKVTGIKPVSEASGQEHDFLDG
jgi:DNA modification methylase